MQVIFTLKRRTRRTSKCVYDDKNVGWRQNSLAITENSCPDGENIWKASLHDFINDFRFIYGAKIENKKNFMYQMQ